jgi:formylglycine-generating enzyme required for sulfatase activity
VSIVVCALLFLCGQPASSTDADKPVSPAAGPKAAPSASENAGDASILFQSVTGYLKGLRQRPGPVADPSKKQRYDPQARIPRDERAEELRRKADRERALGQARLLRGETKPAVQALTRAVEASGQAGQDAAPLKALIEQARQAADTAPARIPAGQTVNSVGMRMVTIPAGKFVMGSTDAEVRRIEADWNITREALTQETPAHTVEIGRPFLIGKYEVTVAEFKRFVQESGYRTVAEREGAGWVYDEGKKHWVKKQGASWRNPGFKVEDDHPVTLICHVDAEAFCKWLSAKEGRDYFLPTEAQWEYAARGGLNEKRFPWGDDYPDGGRLNLADYRSPVPWADRTIDDGWPKVSPVGCFAPNGYGLCDMAGNLWELCADVYNAKAFDGLASKTVIDPAVTGKGKTRVVKGGNWAFGAGICRNSFRAGLGPDTAVDVSGFRVAANAPPISREAGADASPGVTGSPEEALLRRVTQLAREGRRREARRVIDDHARSASKQSPTDTGRTLLVTNLLHTALDLTKDKLPRGFTNSLGMFMTAVPAGSFVMGSSQTDIAWASSTLARDQPANLENEYPFHKVRISRPFFISDTEVTVGQFRAFVEDTGYITDAEDAGGGQVYNQRDRTFEKKAGSSWKNPGWRIEDTQPVVMISYNDAQAFCDWLTVKEKTPYKLPTEAQWEYAARGGLAFGQFPWGDELPDGLRANYADRNTDFPWRDRYVDDGYKYVAPVGSYEANGYGLYDMAGNALEWVRDYYGEDYYRFSPEIDPEGPGHGEFRVMKGGEWTFGPVNLRCAFRGWARPDLAFYNSGFRVVVEYAGTRRSYHFSSNFLTKEWIPGPDNREVAAALAKEKERKDAGATIRPKTSSPAPSGQAEVRPFALPGVMILDFTPKSEGRKAGLDRGDVIIEFNGVRDLNSERFLALSAAAKRDKIRPTLIFVREGVEYGVKVPPGFLGMSLLDTTVKGPFKKPAPAPPREMETPKDGQGKPRDWT